MFYRGGINMTNATLVYELDPTRRVPVKTATLRNIDLETLELNKPSLLMQKYKPSIIPLLKENQDYIKKHPDNKGRFLIEYVKGEESREELPVLYKHDRIRPIIIRSHPVSLNDIKKHIKVNPSEVEKARRLLLSSKYKKFLVSFLKDDLFRETTEFKMKVSKEEYDSARSLGIECFIQNGLYGIKMRDALIYLYKSNKLNHMRFLVEDALELWKKNIDNLEDEELYYYARNLRALIDDYYDNINTSNKTVTNLKVNEKSISKNKIALIKDKKYYEPLKKGHLIKLKLPKVS